MGYYSEVALQFKKDKASQDLIAKAKEHWSEKYWIENEENGIIQFHAEEIKWYESYEEVVIIHKLMDSMEEDDYQFIRVGEDMSDIEELGSYSFDIYVTRQIEGLL